MPSKSRRLVYRVRLPASRQEEEEDEEEELIIKVFSFVLRTIEVRSSFHPKCFFNDRAP